VWGTACSKTEQGTVKRGRERSHRVSAPTPARHGPAHTLRPEDPRGTSRRLVHSHHPTTGLHTAVVPAHPPATEPGPRAVCPGNATRERCRRRIPPARSGLPAPRPWPFSHQCASPAFDRAAPRSHLGRTQRAVRCDCAALELPSANHTRTPTTVETPRIKNTHRITTSHHHRMRTPVVEAPLGAGMSPPGLVECLQLAGNASASLRPHTAAPKTRRMQMPMDRDEPGPLRSAHAPRATTASRHHRPSMPRPGGPRAGRSRQNLTRQN